MPPRFPQTIALRARPALSALVLAAVILGAAGPATADALGIDIDGSASSTTNRAPSFSATTTTTVTDENEPPLAPGAPAVGRVVGSHTSLAASWTAPDNTGRPAIESYDVQYRTLREPWWSMPPRNVTDTAATITHLLRNTTYDVQVRAKNANGDGPWSESGSGTTGKNTAPSFGATSTTRSVAENTEPGQAIGDPVAATDPDSGDTLTYSLEDRDDAAAFDIDEANGQLRTSAALDYETRSSYSVAVVAEDSEGASDSIKVTISVTDEDEDENAPPSFDPTDNMRSVAENTEPGQAIGDPVTATDPEGDTLTYSLGGTDADAFDIDATSGQLLTRDALDYEAEASYSVTVVAEDSEGASASIEVTISVTDEDENENEPPSFDPTDNMRSVAENTEPGQAIGDPVTATDPEGNTLTYRLGGTDADAFGIDEANGQLRTSAALDYETRSSYSVTVVAEDSEGASDSIEVTIAVTNANEPPSFDSTSTTRSVAENADPGHDIGDPVAATDPDSGDTLTYLLGGPDAAAFDIDEANGQLRTRDALDHEAKASYSVRMVALDTQGASASIEVTIEVTDANDPPSFDPDDNTRSVAENTGPGQTIGDPVAATDPDSDETLTYHLEGTDAAAFDIVPTSGQLRTRAALDYEATSSYSVMVVAEDSEGASATIEVTIAVTDENEPPSFDSTSTTRSVAENAAAGHDIGAPVAAMDPDSGETLTYRLEGTDAAAFDIVPTSGQLRTQGALDHEAQSSYSVTVAVEDTQGASATIEVTIAVTDENEPPDAPAAPTFLSATDESLTVSWTPPSTAGRPDITSYDLQYRAGTSNSFTNGPQDITGTTATISGLSPNVAYHVQVRATNDEGDGPWSASGTTITTNDETLQQAWLAHFGRTVAGQVVNAVSGRLAVGGSAHVTVGGTELRLSSETRAAREQLAQMRPDYGARDHETAFGTPGMTERGLAPGSSFHLASNAGPEGSHVLTAWGRYASESFQSADEKLELDGEVTTALFGADAEWDRWLAGVALSFSEGEGVFEPGKAASPGKGKGTLDSTLNSVHPYLRYEMREEGVSVWGLAGYGSGHLTQTDDGARPIDTDIEMRMGALGTRSELLSRPKKYGLGLAFKSDVFWMRMESKAVEEPDGRSLKLARAKASRLRLLVEGSQSFELGSGVELTPSLEMGLRSDGGDAGRGSGMEARAGIRYTAPGMTIEASAHSLFGHQRREYEEWGASGSIRMAPGTSGRGVSLTVAPSWGAATSGVDRLWSIRDTSRLTPNSDPEPGGRLEAEIGYGMGMPGGRGVLTPYAGLSLSNDGERTYRLGGRWNVGPAFSINLEGDRREHADDGSPEHILMLRGTMRW